MFLFFGTEHSILIFVSIFRLSSTNLILLTQEGPHAHNAFAKQRTCVYLDGKLIKMNIVVT